jgi:hypothetical protein
MALLTPRLRLKIVDCLDRLEIGDVAFHNVLLMLFASSKSCTIIADYGRASTTLIPWSSSQATADLLVAISYHNEIDNHRVVDKSVTKSWDGKLPRNTR